MDGSRYWADDIVTIAPVDARHAYVQVELEFANGHQCALFGVATAEGKALVYHEPADGDASGNCHLSITREGTKLRLDDDDGSCSTYCGARGTLTDISLPWKSRNRITDLPRLKTSSEYANAIAAWRKTKDGQ